MTGMNDLARLTGGNMSTAVMLTPIIAGAIAYLGYTLRAIPGRVMAVIRRQWLVEVDVMGNDPLFGYLSAWLDVQAYTRRARKLTASANKSGGGAQCSAPVPVGCYSSAREEEPQIQFTPAPGHHLLWFRGRPVWLHRERKEVSRGDGGWGGYQEAYTLRTIGRDAALLRSLLEEAHRQATAGGRTVGVYVASYGDWHRVREMRPRPLESVVLPEGMSESVTADAERFLGRRDWYEDRGIPWRRGYLFEGDPGSGKTSIIGALAGHLGLDLYMVNLADRTLTDQALTMLLLRVPERSAVLLEDVDAVVQGREMATDNGVTFSGLLNALDGVASKPGVLTFQTSNHADLLDAAHVRAGRVDCRQVFRAATAEQAQRMFLRFFPDAPRELAETFGGRAEGRSMADLQGVLQEHAEAPGAAVDALPTTFPTHHLEAVA